MARPKRNLIATAQATSIPPANLTKSQSIAVVLRAAGNNLYSVRFPSGGSGLVELPARFRSTIWIKRDGYVLVDTEALQSRENKLVGEIVNIVRDEKQWRKEPYWPTEFIKKSSYFEDSDGEESIVGKMPPSELDDDIDHKGHSA